MAPPTVRVNTFVKGHDKAYVDPVSKTFFAVQVVFGLDAMPLIGKGEFIYVFLSFLMFIILNGTVVYLTVLASAVRQLNITPFLTIISNILITLLSFLGCKWLEKYYGELNKFDTEVGCRPKVPKSCIWNALEAALMFIFIVLLFEIPEQIGFMSHNLHHLMPLHMVYVLEVCYFGHLLNLLTPRLKLINYYMESSLSSATSEINSLQKDFVNFKLFDAKLAQCQMRKIMELYQVVVEAYDFLIESIKWQLLVVFISAFATVLGSLYLYTLKAIRTGEILTDASVMQLGLSLVKMLPLFAPCTASDRVHNEVTKLRELLTSRLYENKLDKSERGVARALVAFTETRDLSLRLLRVLDIDISLPFKFMGLLLTYLIILLQFEKVIHP